MDVPSATAEFMHQGPWRYRTLVEKCNARGRRRSGYLGAYPRAMDGGQPPPALRSGDRRHSLPLGPIDGVSTGECQAPLTVGAGLATRTDGAARIPSPGRVWRRYAQSQLEQHVFLLRELRLATLGVRGPELRPAPAESSVSEVAVVFTDLAGFTAFNALHGDGVAVEHLQRVAAFVDNIVADHGGRVVMRLGDGQLLTFTNPDAAIVAALELVHTVPPPLSMRAGAHWGTPVLTRYDVLGHDVNVAARVVDAAPPGGILITKDLRDASSARPDVRFGRVVGRRMKGIKGRVPVCAVRRAA